MVGTEELRPKVPPLPELPRAHGAICAATLSDGPRPAMLAEQSARVTTAHAAAAAAPCRPRGTAESAVESAESADASTRPKPPGGPGAAPASLLDEGIQRLSGL